VPVGPGCLLMDKRQAWLGLGDGLWLGEDKVGKSNQSR